MKNMSTPLKNDEAPSKATYRPDAATVYMVFAVIATSVYHFIAEQEFSSLLTLSGISQCLAFSLLVVHAIFGGGLHGLSLKSLQLHAAAIAMRLSSTTWMAGYLPNDPTGDFVYQAFDVLSLGMVIWLMHHVLCLRRETMCDIDGDTLPALPFIIVSFILALLLHADMNDHPLFDALWMCGLFVTSIAILPQISMMRHGQATAPSTMIAHFVAAMACSCILSFIYMWYAHSEITAEPLMGDVSRAGYAIVAAHTVQLMVTGIFGYFWMRSVKASLESVTPFICV